MNKIIDEIFSLNRGVITIRFIYISIVTFIIFGIGLLLSKHVDKHTYNTIGTVIKSSKIKVISDKNILIDEYTITVNYNDYNNINKTGTFNDNTNYKVGSDINIYYDKNNSLEVNLIPYEFIGYTFISIAFIIFWANIIWLHLVKNNINLGN